MLLAVARASAERGQPVPAATNDWASRVATLLLADADQGAVKRGIELARELRVPSAFDALAGLAKRDSRWPELRMPSIEAAVTLDARRSLPILAAILGQAEENLPLRQKAATSLASMNLPESRAVLVEQLRSRA